jgi:hypothetical protein
VKVTGRILVIVPGNPKPKMESINRIHGKKSEKSNHLRHKQPAAPVVYAFAGGGYSIAIIFILLVMRPI